MGDRQVSMFFLYYSVSKRKAGDVGDENNVCPKRSTETNTCSCIEIEKINHQSSRKSTQGNINKIRKFKLLFCVSKAITQETEQNRGPIVFAFAG